MELHPEITDVHSIVTDLDQLWRPSLENKGVIFTCYVDSSLNDGVILDKTRLRQCLNNLLSNAVKYTHEGRVHLHVTSAPVETTQNIEITAIVADTGAGISDAAQATLFTPFAQESGATTDVPSRSGLNLSITRNLAQMMGGDVTVISKIGRGSEFTLTLRAEKSEDTYVLDEMEALFDSVDILPMADNTQDQATEELLLDNPVISDEQSIIGDIPRENENLVIRTPKDTDNFDPDNLRGLKVLIVEDIPANQDVIKLFLGPEGCESLCAINGREALTILDTQDVDVIIMDIRMPEMDGIEATRAIRQSKTPYRNVPIIALTADAAAETNADCMAAGADIFLTKPVMARELTEAIRFLRRFQETEESDSQTLTA